jgi:hypothetical protein
MFKLAILLVATVLLKPPLPAQQGQETSPESYSATAIGTGGTAGGRSIRFDFRITRYASDEEVQQLAELVRTKEPMLSVVPWRSWMRGGSVRPAAWATRYGQRSVAKHNYRLFD